MTGGSRVAEGPTTKITCRTDKDFILKQTPTNTKLDEFDVSKYEICVGQTGAKTASAYPLVMSISPFESEKGNPIADGHPLVATAGVAMVDASYSTFIRDVYDARTPLECELALRQISIFWDGNGNVNDAKKANPFINGYCNKEMSQVITSRRNAIVVCTDDAAKKQFESDYTTYKKVTMQPFQEVETVAIVFNQDNFADELNTAIANLSKDKKASVFTLRNKTSEAMSVSDWRFHGIALGMAKLDQRDGDNVCTLLRSGAQTIRNGPFKIMAGDPVGWVFPHELCCFDKEGRRKQRWTATVRKLRRLFQATDKMNVIVQENPEVDLGGVLTEAQCFSATIDHTGDGAKNTRLKLQVVPLRMSPGCCKVTDSIRDALERRVGTAISNAAGSAMVDLLVGSDI
jgi:hypothetical protein